MEADGLPPPPTPAVPAAPPVAPTAAGADGLPLPSPKPPPADARRRGAASCWGLTARLRGAAGCWGVAARRPRVPVPARLRAASRAAAAALPGVSFALTVASPVLVLGAGVLALLVPAPFARTITNEWVEACLALTTLSMGLALSPAAVWGALQRPWLVALSLALEYGVAPLSAFTIGHVFRLSPGVRAGFTLMGCTNGGQGSNLCTYLSHGDLGISVLMTLSSSLLATVAIPALSHIYLSGLVSVDAAGLVASTAKLALAPLAVGVVTTAAVGPAVAAIEPLLPMVGIGSLLIIMLGSTALAAELIKGAWQTSIAPIIVFYTLGFCLGYAVGMWLFRLGRPVATALAFESGFKSPPLAFVLARRHFADDPDVQTASAVTILVLAPLVMGVTVAFHLWYVAAPLLP